MADRKAVFELAEVPDPNHPAFCAITAKPREAMWLALAHLLRFVSDLLAGAVTACLRFVFNPKVGGYNPQSRLRVFLGVRTGSAKEGQAIESLLIRGPLARFFTLRPAKAPEFPFEPNAICHLFRNHQRRTPLVDRDFNADVPDHYFVCTPFQPNGHNDYSTLDRVLDSLHEPAVIDVAIEPTDITSLLERHGSYLAQLQRICRTWDVEDDVQIVEDPFGEHKYSRDEHLVLKPLHRPDPAALDVQRTQQRLHDMLAQARFVFHAVVLAQTKATARLLGSTLAEAGFSGGDYELCAHTDKPSIVRIKADLANIKIVQPDTIGPLKQQTHLAGYSHLAPLLHVASVDELTGLFRFPVASCSSMLCVRTNTDPPTSDTGRGSLTLGTDAAASGAGVTLVRCVQQQSLSRHMFISGIPGTGKTTAVQNIVIQLWKQGVPVLILEPVKTEFRALKRLTNARHDDVARLGKELEIYTPGNEDIMPLRLNPLELLPGVTPAEQIDALEGCFHAAMPLGGPLPVIIHEALEEVYDREPQPTIMKLLEAAERALARKRYSAATCADLRGAIDARLGSLTRGSMGRVLRCVRSVPPMNRIWTRHTIIEMDRLSRKLACLLTLFVLLHIRQAARTFPETAALLRLLVVIEEAHNLVGPNTQAEPSEDNPDPKAYASEFVCRMLAEMRAMGVAVVISDQSPSAVAAEVVKLPATKLAFQQPDEMDRAVMGAAMLFGKNEHEDIARLQPGEAYLFTNGYHRPQKIRTVNLHEQMDLRPLADDKLKRIIRSEPWAAEMTKARLEMALHDLTASLNEFDEKRLQYASQAAKLRAKLPLIMELHDPSRRIKSLNKLRFEAAALRDQLEDAHCQFRVRHYIPLMPSEEVILTVSHGLGQLLAGLKARYETVTQRDIKQCMTILEKLIQDTT